MSDRAFSIPSSFLPHLPRIQNSFEPLLTSDLLAHIAILRELYVPPVHGGFEVRDCMVDDDDTEDNGSGTARLRKEKAAKRERRFSAGLAETMDGLGLGLDVGAASGSTSQSGSRLEPVGEERQSSDDDEEELESEKEEESREHLDPFERDWSEKWLNGVVRRSQGWLEENEEDGPLEEVRIMEGLLRDASAALAMMAGTSATGSLTRHLLFPLHPTLEPGLKSLRPTLLANPSLSPAAQTFLSTLATSPTSPMALRNHLASSPTTSHTASEPSSSPSTSFAGSLNSHYVPSRNRQKGKRRPCVPVLLHDAPMQDHLSVGVQTWGSAILLGRRMAKHPDKFGLFDTSRRKEGIRMLELGAGTGLLSILCRKLLDIKAATEEVNGVVTVPSSPGRTRQSSSDGLIVATDFLPEVLDNLKLCVDLNFPTPIGSTSAGVGSTSGIHIAKLDWTTFPAYMNTRSASFRNGKVDLTNGGDTAVEEESGRFMDEPFDLVLASDCVYDETHARMLREVASSVLRLPDEGTDDQGGTFHILSPIRPTFTPELESIDVNFPPHPVQPSPTGQTGEGLGAARGLRLGTRGGKRSMVGRKGEGRIDENAGYWWWEVGWA